MLISSIQPETFSAIVSHIGSELPREACGILLKDGSYFPARNVHPDPENHFRMHHEDASRFPTSQIAAVVHSHPDGLQCPSASDMAGQIAMGVPWIIFPLKGTELLTPFSFGGPDRPPLIGRSFRHGVTDCFSCLRDGLMELYGEYHPDFPRDWEWWLSSEDLYLNHFRDYGYERFDPQKVEPQPADILLCSVAARGKLNHGILYLGNSIGLHHVGSRYEYDPTRLSRRENIARYASQSPFWIRKSPSASRGAL